MSSTLYKKVFKGHGYLNEFCFVLRRLFPNLNHKFDHMTDKDVQNYLYRLFQ